MTWLEQRTGPVPVIHSQASLTPPHLRINLYAGLIPLSIMRIPHGLKITLHPAAGVFASCLQDSQQMSGYHVNSIATPAGGSQSFSLTVMVSPHLGLVSRLEAQPPLMPYMPYRTFIWLSTPMGYRPTLILIDRVGADTREMAHYVAVVDPPG